MKSTFKRLVRFASQFAVFALFAAPLLAQEQTGAAWRGWLRNRAGAPIARAKLQLVGAVNKTATTGSDGEFLFSSLSEGQYHLSAVVNGNRINCDTTIDLKGAMQPVVLTMTDVGLVLSTGPQEESGTESGEKLTSEKVNELPLNKRDFSALLLMAAGTMTDANGATNFTAQFAINGQRGVEAVFAMNGADISDPEMGGSTFSNFNVDAVQDIQSTSGWMPAKIGQGAAGFTNIITRSGDSGFHGSFFEFLRNSALDARNYFDYSTPETPGIFRRSGETSLDSPTAARLCFRTFTTGGERHFISASIKASARYSERRRYSPCRLRTERNGIDASAYPGDVLYVPVDPSIAAILARYPLPNFPTGSYGVHTYATYSKVDTNADQFSIRLDHKLSDKNQFFGQFNFNNITGPTTNPDQTTIDPLFGVTYVDRQRNVAFTFTRTQSPNLSMQTEFGITRSTPSFPTQDYTDPAVKFNDALFEGFNTAGGSVMSAYGNLFQLQQSFAINKGSHTIAAGGEVRLNRDSTFFGTSPNGEYDFGGGTSYALSIYSFAERHAQR